VKTDTSNRVISTVVIGNTVESQSSKIAARLSNRLGKQVLIGCSVGVLGDGNDIIPFIEKTIVDELQKNPTVF